MCAETTKAGGLREFCAYTFFVFTLESYTSKISQQISSIHVNPLYLLNTRVLSCHCEEDSIVAAHREFSLLCMIKVVMKTIPWKYQY